MRPSREFDHLIWPLSDITHIWPDLKPGMTIGWWEGPDGPDYLNVLAVHPPDPDDEDWVYIDTIEHRGTVDLPDGGEIAVVVGGLVAECGGGRLVRVVVEPEGRAS